MKKKTLRQLLAVETAEQLVLDWRTPEYGSEPFIANYTDLGYVGIIQPHVCRLCGKQEEIFQGFYHRWVCKDPTLDNVTHKIRSNVVEFIPKQATLEHLSPVVGYCVDCIKKELNYAN